MIFAFSSNLKVRFKLIFVLRKFAIPWDSRKKGVDG
jgi:hypothetical protein